ncbi:MAG TPA: cell division protein FtsA [Candidatus Moranbacteria bacterium]|nr:cell division protein FtsA [Candidatus Moranbacteria bacterium]
MSKNSGDIIVGIDIGSSGVRTVVAQQIRGENELRVIGVGSAPSFGIRRGVIIDVEDVTKSINDSLELAEKMSGINIKSAILNIGGGDIDFQDSKGVVAVGRADGEVTEDDVNRAIAEAQNVPLPMNKEIVHVVARKYRLDDKDNIKDPLEMKGVRLEADTLLIESSSTNIKNISKCMYQANVEIDDLVLEPLAAAKSVLSKKQKELGVVLVNIGGGTTSIAVYEEGDLVYTAILPVGAGHVTNDIAIGLRTSIDVAEKIKLEYGSALSREVNKKDGIDLAQIDSKEEGIISRYHVAEIIEARLEEIFSLVQEELKKIGKANLLPSGAVLVGGGAKLVHIAEIAKEILGLPVQIGFPTGFKGILDKFDDPSFATVAGLVLWEQEKHSSQNDGFMGLKSFESLARPAGKTVNKMSGWLKKFLP